MRNSFLIALSAVIAFTPQAVMASAGKPDTPAEATKPTPDIPPPMISVSRRTGTFGGTSVSYTATAKKETFLKAEDNRKRASFPLPM